MKGKQNHSAVKLKLHIQTKNQHKVIIKERERLVAIFWINKKCECMFVQCTVHTMQTKTTKQRTNIIIKIFFIYVYIYFYCFVPGNKSTDFTCAMYTQINRREREKKLCI